mmetsp:Transcript_13754/g.28853  ORF Transcript_13754/g.28853 Transcript_13754/m.28853 type:complete len:106 (-) Transcript_13754:1830-2147(-)
MCRYKKKFQLHVAIILSFIGESLVAQRLAYLIEGPSSCFWVLHQIVPPVCSQTFVRICHRVSLHEELLVGYLLLKLYRALQREQLPSPYLILELCAHFDANNPWR